MLESDAAFFERLSHPLPGIAIPHGLGAAVAPHEPHELFDSTFRIERRENFADRVDHHRPVMGVPDRKRHAVVAASARIAERPVVGARYRRAFALAANYAGLDALARDVVGEIAPEFT